MSDPNTAERLAAEAQTAYREGAYAEAAQKFAEAAEAYARLGENLKAAELRNNSSVAWHQAGEHAKALAAAEGTPEVFATAGDAEKEGLAWGNIGSALEGLKRWQEAAEAYQRSAERLEHSNNREARAAVLNALAAVQLRLKEPVEAFIAAQQAVNNQPASPKKWLVKKLLKIYARLAGGH